MFKTIEYEVESASGTIENLKWDISKNKYLDLFLNLNWRNKALIAGYINKSATKFYMKPTLDYLLGARQSMVNLRGQAEDDKTIIVRFSPSLPFVFSLLGVLFFLIVFIVESDHRALGSIILIAVLATFIIYFIQDMNKTEKLMDVLIKTAEDRRRSEFSR